MCRGMGEDAGVEEEDDEGCAACMPAECLGSQGAEEVDWEKEWVGSVCDRWLGSSGRLGDASLQLLSASAPP